MVRKGENSKLWFDLKSYAFTIDECRSQLSGRKKVSVHFQVFYELAYRKFLLPDSVFFQVFRVCGSSLTEGSAAAQDSFSRQWYIRINR